MRSARHLLSAAAFSAFPAFAWASPGAWTQASGQGILIITADYYSTESYFNQSGRKQSQPRYSKEELNPYVEYGLADGVTAGASLFLDRLDDSSHTNLGLSNSDVFLRERLWHDDRSVISLQEDATLPAWGRSASAPILGDTAPTTAISALAGTHFDLFGRTHYVEGQIGYNLRFGPPSDQVLASLSAGFSITPELTLMPQVFQTLRVHAGNPSFTESAADDYDLTRAQLSGVYQLTKEDAVQLGGFAHVAGRNAGDGEGIFMAYWRSF